MSKQSTPQRELPPARLHLAFRAISDTHTADAALHVTAALARAAVEKARARTPSLPAMVGLRRATMLYCRQVGALPSEVALGLLAAAAALAPAVHLSREDFLDRAAAMHDIADAAAQSLLRRRDAPT